MQWKLWREKNKKNKIDDDDDDEESDNIEKNENDNKEDNEDFYECIKSAANEEFIKTFYFGIIQTKDYKEKIVFDNENSPITYLWDGICDNALNFLRENKYPLLYQVDKYYLKFVLHFLLVYLYLMHEFLLSFLFDLYFLSYANVKNSFSILWKVSYKLFLIFSFSFWCSG